MISVEVRCERCRDRGWVTGLDQYGEKTARRCDCHGSTSIALRESAVGIPPRYAQCGVSGFHTAASSATQSVVLARAKTQCQHYIDRFLDLEGGYREAGLLFEGEPGSGKTHLAVAVLRDLMIQYGVRGFFVDFGSLVEDIQASFDPANPTTKHSILRPVQQAEVLVLDELGVRKPTPFVSDVLYSVINERYKRRRPTLFTTNYRVGSPGPRHMVNLDRGADDTGASSGQFLETRIPRMLLSRLFEMTTVISLFGVADYRREIGMHRNEL